MHSSSPSEVQLRAHKESFKTSKSVSVDILFIKIGIASLVYFIEGKGYPHLLLGTSTKV